MAGEAPSFLDHYNYNEQCWQQLPEQDYDYLVGPRNYPAACPWCKGRFIHSEACDELRASWEPVMPYGKFKGWKISKVPEDYKAWLRRQPGLPAELAAVL